MTITFPYSISNVPGGSSPTPPTPSTGTTLSMSQPVLFDTAKSIKGYVAQGIYVYSDVTSQSWTQPILTSNTSSELVEFSDPHLSGGYNTSGTDITFIEGTLGLDEMYQSAFFNTLYNIVYTPSHQ